jgi:hypothetical protein
MLLSPVPVSPPLKMAFWSGFFAIAPFLPAIEATFEFSQASMKSLLLLQSAYARQPAPAAASNDASPAEHAAASPMTTTPARSRSRTRRTGLRAARAVATRAPRSR